MCCTGFGAGEGNRTLVISLEGFCSTIELHPPWDSTPSATAWRATPGKLRHPTTQTSPHPPVPGARRRCQGRMFFVISPVSSPPINLSPCAPGSGRKAWWRRLDSNQRRRTPTDLQSAPFSRSGTPPAGNRKLSLAHRGLSNRTAVRACWTSARWGFVGASRRNGAVRQDLRRRERCRRELRGSHATHPGRRESRRRAPRWRPLLGLNVAPSAPSRSGESAADR